jgi:hypothetical protein
MKTKVLAVETIKTCDNPNAAIPTLASMGYGVFTGKSLIRLGLSEQPPDRAEYARLISEHEPQICKIALGIVDSFEIQPVNVRKLKAKDSYDCMGNTKQVLAYLYNACRMQLPARLHAIVEK